MFYTVYKTINLLNNKEYVGFHQIKKIEMLKETISETGSIFKDGYMGSGKLIKSALEKYGPMNMRQELILVTTDKSEAEDMEKFIVNREWVDSDDTYNLSIGGGVTILFGDKNGFYGKKHSSETIQKIQESRNKTYKNEPFSWSKSFLTENPEITFLTRSEIFEYFNINSWIDCAKLVKSGTIQYSCQYLQEACLRRLENYLRWESGKSERLEYKRELVSKRFKGIPKTEESNLKRGASISKWIENNPENHQERMLKINKNPEKIAKTAETHRGMKRSPETCKNISASLKGKTAINKGKMYIVNLETNVRKMIDKNSDVPEGWIKGLKVK